MRSAAVAALAKRPVVHVVKAMTAMHSSTLHTAPSMSAHAIIDDPTSAPTNTHSNNNNSISPKKVYKSAVVVVPPEHAWPQIQALRQVHDKHYARWMPHITLLYPFYENSGDAFAQAAARMRARLSGFGGKFDLELKEFKSFRHNRSCTLWLNPGGDIDSHMSRLQAALQAEFPDCDDVSRISSRFTPHLSVGQWPTNKATEAVDSLSREWQPLRFTVDRVCIISRKGFHDPFTIRETIMLRDDQQAENAVQPCS
eukprot:jgi/Chlat1/8690/Chrsp88S08066